jgi:hypothetical protein
MWSLLIILTLLLGLARLPEGDASASHFATTVQINNSTIQRGQNGTVTVDLNAMGGENPEIAVGFTLVFDPTQLAYISAALGSGATGASLISNSSQASAGKVGFALARSPGNGFPAGTHQILVITMLSLATGTSATTPLTIGNSPVAFEVVAVNSQNVPATAINGTATLVNGCNYSIAPPARYFSAKAGSGAVTITATPGCPWIVSNFPSWVTFTSPTGGVGSGAISFNVDPNSGAARTGAGYVAGNPFSINQGTNFLDVPQDDIFYDVIGKISAARITVGCDAGGTQFCPLSPVTRGQMAAFIIRALGNFTPPTPTSQRFLDVPPNDIFYAFIEELAVRGITLGCNANGPLYCPTSNVTREQMAAFIIRALGNFSPPPPAFQRFTDVPPNNIFYAFIDSMAARGITLGCNQNGTLYCPAQEVTRGQMAAFLARAFLP